MMGQVWSGLACSGSFGFCELGVPCGNYIVLYCNAFCGFYVTPTGYYQCHPVTPYATHRTRASPPTSKRNAKPKVEKKKKEKQDIHRTFSCMLTPLPLPRPVAVRCGVSRYKCDNFFFCLLVFPSQYHVHLIVFTSISDTIPCLRFHLFTRRVISINIARFNNFLPEIRYLRSIIPRRTTSQSMP